jgi:Skp family chaperone for outer membrane proteins
MRILFAAMAVIALTSGAEAYCFPVPDNADTGYVANDLNRTLCIQRELSQSTEARNVQTQIDATLSKMQRDLQQQKFMLQQQQSLTERLLRQPQL